MVHRRRRLADDDDAAVWVLGRLNCIRNGKSCNEESLAVPTVDSENDITEKDNSIRRSVRPPPKAGKRKEKRLKALDCVQMSKQRLRLQTPPPPAESAVHKGCLLLCRHRCRQGQKTALYYVSMQLQDKERQKK
jgi:hypothetical protein